VSLPDPYHSFTHIYHTQTWSSTANNCKAARRSTRNQIDLPSSIPNSSAVGDDDSDFLQLSMSKTRTVKAKNASTRDSLSSVSTVDNNESSSYSTPATSAFATPAPQVSANKSAKSRRGRRSAAMTIEDDIAPVVSLAERSAFLRNSQYSLNRPTSLKRKIADSEDDEDDELDADEDNSRDAQLARALQAEEDKLANTMHDNLPLRQTPRKVRKLASKSRFFADSDDEMADYSPSKLKVELASSASNAVAFSSKKVTRKSQVPDSDDTDDFIEIEDSDEEDLVKTEDEDLTITSSRKVSSLSKAVKADKFSPRRKAMPPPQAPKNRKGSTLKRENTIASAASSALTSLPTDSEFDDGDGEILSDATDFSDSSESEADGLDAVAGNSANPRSWRRQASRRAGRSNLSREERDRQKLIKHHPEILTMWKDVEDLPTVKGATIEQPTNISRQLKPFQLEGVGWMKAMEQTEWGGGLLGDEMGMGKTIQAVSLIMSDFPARQPSLVLIPPVALMQWQQEIADYTDGTLKTLVYHGTNKLVKKATVKELMKYDVILMSYNSLESMYRKQEKGFRRGDEVHKEKSLIHQIRFHRVILDEAHSIKVRLLNLHVDPC
jgi:DNA repair protein RAD16